MKAMYKAELILFVVTSFCYLKFHVSSVSVGYLSKFIDTVRYVSAKVYSAYLFDFKKFNLSTFG